MVNAEIAVLAQRFLVPAQGLNDKKRCKSTKPAVSSERLDSLNIREEIQNEHTCK